VLYIFAGPDQYTLNQSLEKLKQGIGDTATLAACTVYLDGQHVSADELFQVCHTIPFLVERRLVIIHNLLARVEAKAKSDRPASEKTVGDNARFAACLTQLPETTIVVMIEEEPPKGSAFFKELTGQAVVKTFPILKDPEVQAWIKERVAGLDGRITAQAVALLSRLVGSDLWSIANEIEKLTLFAGDRPIEASDIEALVGNTQEVSVFALIDAFVDSRAETAGRLLQQLLQHGAAPSYLLYMLDRQFRLIVRARELIDLGRPLPSIQTTLAIRHDFAFRRTIEQARKYDMARLKYVYHALLDTDIAVKTGRFDADLAVHLLVAEICQKPTQAAIRAPSR
jgi:DNA polymerase-3 subunit delta